MVSPVLPDVGDYNTFGGVLRDFAPCEDPTTDLSALYLNRIFAQCAMLSHTAPRAMARVTVSGGAATLADHDAVWGATSGVAPVVFRVSAGIYTVTWAAAYDDLQSTPESHAVNIRFPMASVYNDASAARITVAASSSRQLTVLVFDDSGASVNFDPEQFTVWWR